MPTEPKLINPEKLVKVEKYLELLPKLPGREIISKPTVYRRCESGLLEHVYIDGVLHIILD